MKVRVQTLSLMMVACFCLAGIAAAQEARIEPGSERPMFTRLPATLHSPRNIIEASSTPLQTWNGSFTYNGTDYSYNMVGVPPYPSSSATIATYIIPIKQDSSLAPRQAMNYDGNPGGVRYLEEGQPPVVIHATVEAARQARRAPLASTSNNLSYHGGIGDGSAGTIGVETAPKIYVVFWGSQWNNNDPSGEAGIVESFLTGASGSSWLNSVTQYCQGVASGTFFCNGAGTAAGNKTGEFIGFWYDNASAAPSKPRQSQLAAEAVRAAAHFGNTTVASNASAQYVIATATGNNSSGFGRQYCAYHSSTSSTSGDIAYTNLPYITDAGASCGANFNGLGSKAGITIVEGHEAGETITDQFPNGGWLDSGGAENGDKCAWITTGNQGAAAAVSFSTGSFPVQSLWSNAFNSDSGGCVLSY